MNPCRLYIIYPCSAVDEAEDELEEEKPLTRNTLLNIIDRTFPPRSPLDFSISPFPSKVQFLQGWLLIMGVDFFACPTTHKWCQKWGGGQKIWISRLIYTTSSYHRVMCGLVFIYVCAGGRSVPSSPSTIWTPWNKASPPPPLTFQTPRSVLFLFTHCQLGVYYIKFFRATRRVDRRTKGGRWSRLRYGSGSGSVFGPRSWAGPNLLINS